MLTRVFGLQIALLGLVCAGCAAQNSGDASQMFKSGDSDANGTLSPQEVHSLLDSNKDGAISPEEWNQLMVDPADD